MTLDDLEHRSKWRPRPLAKRTVYDDGGRAAAGEGRELCMTLDDLEHRPPWPAQGWRPYDELDPSRILHPNGSRMACGDRELAAALVRAVLATCWQPAADQGRHPG